MACVGKQNYAKWHPNEWGWENTCFTTSMVWVVGNQNQECYLLWGRLGEKDDLDDPMEWSGNKITKAFLSMEWDWEPKRSASSAIYGVNFDKKMI